MPILAAASTQAPGSTFMFILQLVFMLFSVVSFVIVAFYVTQRVRDGRFLESETASRLYTVSGPFGFFFAASVLALVFLQSLFYPMVVLFGIAGVLVQDGRTAWQQFGLARLDSARLLNWSLLAFGAIVLVEMPVSRAGIWILDAIHVPHPEQESVETLRQASNPVAIFAFVFQAVLLFPVIEEMFFRGFLLTFLKKYTSTWLALVLSAGVFAFAHVNLNAVLPLWFLGVALGVAYEQTGSLLLPIAIHSCFNLTTAVSILLDKGSS